jgi:hypothetical protein
MIIANMNQNILSFNREINMDGTNYFNFIFDETIPKNLIKPKDQ